MAGKKTLFDGKQRRWHANEAVTGGLRPYWISGLGKLVVDEMIR